MRDNIKDIGDYIGRSELVESFSKHAKLSNKYMFGILFVSVTIAMKLNPTDKIELPFVGEVTVELYYLISIALLSCLIILFSSSHLMALRIREYYNLFFDKENDKDYFDLVVEPTIFRMAPISWMIKNRSVFFINRDKENNDWKKIELVVYFVLKLFVFIIAYLFPLVILFIILYKSDVLNFCTDINLIIRLFLISLTVISIISFVIVWINEVSFILKMPRKIFKN